MPFFLTLTDQSYCWQASSLRSLSEPDMTDVSDLSDLAHQTIAGKRQHLSCCHKKAIGCFRTAEKNLRALKTILKDLPANTRLAFVGDGPERVALQQEYADMPNVKFMVSTCFSSQRQELNHDCVWGSTMLGLLNRCSSTLSPALAK